MRLGKTILAGLLAALSICGCQKSEAVIDQDQVNQAGLTNVEVTTVQLTVFEEYLQITGHTEAVRDIVISSEQGGTVQELLVDLGDHVRSGQVLSRVNADIYQAQLAEAEAAFRLKQAGLKKSQALYERGSITSMQMLTAQVEHDAAEARVELARVHLDRAVIKAPFAGIIDERRVEQGEMVLPGGAMLRLVDRSVMKIKSEFSEMDVTAFSPGATAEAVFDALPGRSFGARLSFVATSADPASRTFPCEFKLENPDELIKSGMIVRIRVLKEIHRDALVLPQTALLESENGKSVFVLEGETAHKKEVRVGASGRGMVVVSEGLAPQEVVVINGHRDLVDGEKVRITGRKD